MIPRETSLFQKQAAAECSTVGDVDLQLVAMIQARAESVNNAMIAGGTTHTVILTMHVTCRKTLMAFDAVAKKRRVFNFGLNSQFDFLFGCT